MSERGIDTDLAEFVARAQPTVRRLLETKSDEPDDLCQEVMLRLVARVRRYGWPDDSLAWCCATAWRLASNGARDAATRRTDLVGELEDAAGGLAPSAEEAVLHRQRVLAVRAAVRHLPTEQRRVIELVSGGHSYEEVAAATGTSTTSVKGRVQRAYRALRALLPNPAALSLLPLGFARGARRSGDIARVGLVTALPAVFTVTLLLPALTPWTTPQRIDPPRHSSGDAQSAAPRTAVLADGSGAVTGTLRTPRRSPRDAEYQPRRKTVAGCAPGGVVCVRTSPAGEEDADNGHRLWIPLPAPPVGSSPVPGVETHSTLLPWCDIAEHAPRGHAQCHREGPTTIEVPSPQQP